MRWKILLFLILAISESENLKSKCYYELKEPRGIIQTPNFPKPFKTPFKCTWKISNYEGTQIVVYLTQLYVLNGLNFKEFIFDENKATRINVTDDYEYRKHIISTHPNMLIEFSMDYLEGNQLRALGGLSDVYGFNFTYEITDDNNLFKHHSCSYTNCSYNGHCYTDYT